jgi:hypothetical protein
VSVGPGSIALGVQPLRDDTKVASAAQTARQLPLPQLAHAPLPYE